MDVHRVDDQQNKDLQWIYKEMTYSLLTWIWVSTLIEGVKGTPQLRQYKQGPASLKKMFKWPLSWFPTPGSSH